MTIRPARPEDARAITAIHAAGWRAGYGDFLPADVLETAIRDRSTRWTGLLAAPLPPGGGLLVTETDGEISGFAHTAPHDERDGALMLLSFYIRPDRWGDGSAARLMDAVLESATASGCGSVYLTTWDKSTRARRFYERAGFRKTGRSFESDLAHATTVVNIEYRYELGGGYLDHV